MNYLRNRISCMQPGGMVGHVIAANETGWLHTLFADNPRLLAGFETPDDPTIFKTMWHGEFPGKLLTGIAQTYLLGHNPDTLALGNRLASALRAVQEPCGYLGPWPESVRFDRDTAVGGSGKWDTWGQYHCIFGLFRWYQVTGNREAKDTAIRALDHIYDYFIKGGVSVTAQNWAECNLAIAHAFALFYEETGNERYLEAAERLVHQDMVTPYSDFYSQTALACNWLQTALAGIPYYASGQPRWEGLYTLETFAVLYRVTGQETYRRATEALWQGMVDFDRHNTGSFGTGEGATGDPYGAGSETCNTVAWMAFTTDFLAMTRDPRAADELELAFFNATLGSLLDGERNFTYMNSSDGTREAARITLEGHSYNGGRDMSCCQANGNRGITQIAEWALLTDGYDLYLNYYGEMTATVPLDDGHTVTVTQHTAYPTDGLIRITVDTDCPVPLTLHLRIPTWSADTALTVNGEAVSATAGSYCALKRVWKKADTVELTMDMAPHFWDARAINGKVSVYRGPLLLSCRPSADGHEAIHFSMDALRNARPTAGEGLVCLAVSDADGNDRTLMDYYTAGKGGDAYISWLPCDGESIPHNSTLPIWCQR